MRRAELSILACVALGGCMKIYPDPELPDIEMEWYDGDCQSGTGDVVLAIDGVDDPNAHAEMTVPCNAVTASFTDVARERYRVTGTLLDAAGVPFSSSHQDADLRNGVNANVSMYFGGGSNVRIGFVFDMGATCQSLNASYIEARFTMMGQPSGFSFGAICEDEAVFRQMAEGSYTVELRAITYPDAVVAVSETSTFDVAPDGVTRVGPLALVPCGASCPSARATLPP